MAAPSMGQNLRAEWLRLFMVDCGGPVALSKLPAGDGNRHERADKVFHRKPPFLAQKTLTGIKREGYDSQQVTKTVINGAWECVCALFARW